MSAPSTPKKKLLVKNAANRSAPSVRKGRFNGEHVLSDPIPGRYPWSQTFECSCGIRLASSELAKMHVENFNKKSRSATTSSGETETVVDRANEAKQEEAA